MQRVSSPHDSGQRAVTTEVGVAVRNRPHIVVFDKLVLLEWISLAGKKGATVVHIYLNLKENQRAQAV